MRLFRALSCVAALALTPISVSAQDACDAACEAARKAQDPLAAVTALLTDNTIGYGPTKDDTVHNYQLQPVFTIEGENANVILRGVIPYLGVPDGSGGTNFGISDTVLQGFYVPEVSPGSFKIGYGLQASIDTAKNATFTGPGNGGGFALVGFGFAGNLSYGGILGHLWGQNKFSTSTIQPIVFYNMPNFLGGSYVGYSNTISYDWNAAAGDAWTVPLGATFGKTFVLNNGHAIDANIGAYSLLDAPKGGNDWQLKFGLSWFLP